MLVYGCRNICMIYVYGYIKAKGAKFNGKGLDAEVSGSIYEYEDNVRLNVDTRTETFYQYNG